MAGTSSSMSYSLLLFIVIFSLQEMYRSKLASSELYTILGGFTSSLLFIVLLTAAVLVGFQRFIYYLAQYEFPTRLLYVYAISGFIMHLIHAYRTFYIVHLYRKIAKKFIGNYQESVGVRTGWGAVIFAEAVAVIAAGTVHRVCITTCFLFSAGLLYEINKLSGMTLSKSESKTRRH